MRLFSNTAVVARQSQGLEDHVRFSGSDADSQAVNTFIPRKRNAPSYQPICVLSSLVAFMVYFCILREENDIDEYLGRDVFTYMDPHGQSVKLQKQLEDEMKAGKDTAATREKLAVTKTLIESDRGDLGLLEASLQRIKASKDQKARKDP